MLTLNPSCLFTEPSSGSHFEFHSANSAGERYSTFFFFFKDFKHSVRFFNAVAAVTVVSPVLYLCIDASAPQKEGERWTTCSRVLDTKRETMNTCDKGLSSPSGKRIGCH